MSTETPKKPGTEDSVPRRREEDAIYQNNQLVARVLDPEVNPDQKEIQFAELYSSDLLVLPEECEYQKYRILVRRIEYASKVNKEEPHKGRILRGVAAEILGYREQ